MKRTKSMRKVLKTLHEQPRREVPKENSVDEEPYVPLAQKMLTRVLYELAVSDVLNATVRADSTRTYNQMANERLIKEIEPHKWIITKYGVAWFFNMDKPFVPPPPIWSFKKKGIRKKKVSN